MPSHWATDPHYSCTHKTYGLSCVEYDALVERSNGGCELCRRPWGEGEPVVRPQVDHDHFALDGWVGVRGLVCSRCNAHMRRVDNAERPIDARTRAYLDNAWHLTALAHLHGEVWGLGAFTCEHYQRNPAYEVEAS